MHPQQIKVSTIGNDAHFSGFAVVMYSNMKEEIKKASQKLHKLLRSRLNYSEPLNASFNLSNSSLLNVTPLPIFS